MSIVTSAPSRLPEHPAWFPDLPEGWRRERLGYVALVRARIGWKALTADEYVPDGYVFLATPNIKGDTIDFENVNYISEFRYEESSELQLAVDDVLLAKDGNTLGIVNLVTELPRPATVNGSIAVIRSRSINPAFLRYYLDSNIAQQLVDALKSGMGVPHLYQFDLNRFPVPVPPVATQRAIADYLDRETARIDGLIEAKRKMKSLLWEELDARRDLKLINAADGMWVPLQRLTDPYRPIVYGIVQAGEEVPDGVPYIKTGDLTNFRPSLLSSALLGVLTRSGGLGGGAVGRGRRVVGRFGSGLPST